MPCSFRSTVIAAVVAALGLFTFPSLGQRDAGVRNATFDNSLLIAPHYVEYTAHSEERFASQAAELKRRLGSAPYVMTGFAAGLTIQYPESNLDQRLSESQMVRSLQEIDRVVERARANNIVVHITLMSGFFHGMNDLRKAAIRQDVRNAQWFADGWIADPAALAGRPEVPSSAWVTPSRYARTLRARMEEGARIVGSKLAARMMDRPQTLVTVSGDGEVELSFERSNPDGERVAPQPQYADYSPFMIEEFRDWIKQSRYEGDGSPATDDNRDGRTFNRDFKTSFSTWRLRYFDASGPIPFSRYAAMSEKLPSSGPYFIDGGFDAPRIPQTGDPYWELWMQFRVRAVANYIRDFASWITTSPAPGSSFTVPPSRFYSHQIPGDFLFGQRSNQRLVSSASPAETSLISPIGSAGVTVFNTFDGLNYGKTGTSELFKLLSRSSANWGVFEYNLSVPVRTDTPSTDMTYYMSELRNLYEYRPHVIVPFAWTDTPHLKTMNIQNSPFEAALKRFIADVGNVPWSARD
jgi:hypothetical protein